MPVTYFAKSFGAYVYDDLRDGLGDLKQQIGFRHRQSKSFNRDGAFALASLQDPRRLTMTGTLTGPNGAQDPASLRAALDAFAAAHAAGAPQPLQIDSDRYLNAQVETLDDEFDGLAHEISVGFICFDPFWYAMLPTALPLTVGGTTSVTPAGLVKCLPQISLTATAAGGLVTVASNRDATFTFAPPSAGTFTLDSLAEKITDGAGTDQTGQFTGDLITLLTEANQITVTASGGASLSGASITWRDRWL